MEFGLVKFWSREEDGNDVSNRFLKKHNLLGVSVANKLTLRSYATEW